MTSKDIAIAFTSQGVAAGFKVVEQVHNGELTPTVFTASDEEFKAVHAAISLPFGRLSYFSHSTERWVYPVFKNSPASQYE